MAPTSARNSQSQWQPLLMAMLPRLHRSLRIAFRDLAPEARAEATQDAISSICIAVARLAKQGRLSRAFATALARYAAAQIRCGRSVGARLNCEELLSRYAQRRNRFFVERLDRFDTREGTWREAIVADTRTPILDQVAFRLDFSDWLRLLTRRDRCVALELARGETTSAVATRFGISCGRVSQLRSELCRSWLVFQGEAVAA